MKIFIGTAKDTYHGWSGLGEDPDNAVDVHVYPSWQEHDTNTKHCICNPNIERQPNGRMLVIHNEFKEC